MRFRGRPIQSRLRAAPHSLLCNPYLLSAISEAGILQDFRKFRGHWPTVNCGNSDNSGCLTGPNRLANYTGGLTASSEYH